MVGLLIALNEIDSDTCLAITLASCETYSRHPFNSACGDLLGLYGKHGTPALFGLEEDISGRKH